MKLRAETTAVGPAALPERGGCLWWSQGMGLVGEGRAVSLEVGTGVDRGRRAWASLQRILGERLTAGEPAVALGSFTFDPANAGSVLFVPEALSVYDTPQPLEDSTGTVGLDRMRYARAEMDELRWLDEVAALIADIDRGTPSKVVLARDEIVWGKTDLSERTIALRLTRAFPQCFTFVCDGLVGATPELLVRRKGRKVESLVLAGSARRGSDPDEDAFEAHRLLASSKERSEHSLALGSVTEVLGRVCSDVVSAAEPEILRLANVQHLATRVTARLDDPDGSVLELVDLLHPTAAVGGVPADAALARIRQVEGNLRGRYAGPVGWVDANGDGEWGIALRCALLSGNRARLFAGAGIVSGSLPEAELEETRLKFRAMESALGLAD